MTTVREMLEEKDTGIFAIGPGDSVFAAIEVMAEKEVGALPVVDDAARLVGIISERDYARKVILQNKSSRDTAVSAIMSRELVTVRQDEHVDGCMALMSGHRIRHLPVIDGDRLIGVVAVGDVLKHIIREQSEAIEELESYIMEETGGSG